MKTFILFLSCLLLSNINMASGPTPKLSILSLKNNQKVRGEYKIYGKAKPGALVKVQINSSYYKTAHDNQERIFKGAGPLNRMNRKFSVTADRGGRWTLKSIDLTNAGWEETFTIKASTDDETVTIQVYDQTRPVNL